MYTKILAVVGGVLVAGLLLVSMPVVAATPQAERDFYECSKTATILPPLDEIKSCMVEKGHSDDETANLIGSLPDQDLFAPYTGARQGAGDSGGSGGGGGGSSGL